MIEDVFYKSEYGEDFLLVNKQGVISIPEFVPNNLTQHMLELIIGAVMTRGVVVHDEPPYGKMTAKLLENMSDHCNITDLFIKSANDITIPTSAIIKVSGITIQELTPEHYNLLQSVAKSKDFAYPFSETTELTIGIDRSLNSLRFAKKMNSDKIALACEDVKAVIAGVY